MNKSSLCLRCTELHHESNLAEYLCTVKQQITQRVNDVPLCEVCMKYMKKMNLLVKVYDEDEEC